MIALIFSMSLLLSSSVSLIYFTTYTAIDNTFTSLSYSLPNEWIILEPEGSKKPMYDRVKVENTTIDHLKRNLNFYLDDIHVGFYYFDSETLKELSTRYVSGVRISIKAQITLFKTYSKAMTYTIFKPEQL